MMKKDAKLKEKEKENIQNKNNNNNSNISKTKNSEMLNTKKKIKKIEEKTEIDLVYNIQNNQDRVKFLEINL